MIVHAQMAKNSLSCSRGVSLSIHGSSSGGRAVSGKSRSEFSGSDSSISFMLSHARRCVRNSGKLSSEASWGDDCCVFMGLFLRGGGVGFGTSGLGLAKMGALFSGGVFLSGALAWFGGVDTTGLSLVERSGLLCGEGPLLPPGVRNKSGDGEGVRLVSSWPTSLCSRLFFVRGVFGTDTAVGGSTSFAGSREECRSSVLRDRGRGKESFSSGGRRTASFEGEFDLLSLNRLRKLLFLFTSTLCRMSTGREVVGSGSDGWGDAERCRWVIANAFLKESHFLTLANFFALGPGLWIRHVIPQTHWSTVICVYPHARILLCLRY